MPRLFTKVKSLQRIDINVQEAFFSGCPACSPFAKTLVQKEEYYFLTLQHNFLKHMEFCL